MSTTEDPRGTSGDASVGSVDMKLEAVVIPVSDVDRGEGVLRAARVAARRRPRDRRPSGSSSSTLRAPTARVQFGTGLTAAAPGSAQNLLVVSDIEAAHDDLVATGADAERGLPRRQRRLQPLGRLELERAVPIPTDAPTRRSLEFTRPRRQPLAAAGDHEPAARAAIDATTATFSSVDELAARARAGRGRARRAREAHRARPTTSWPEWYAAYMLAEQTGDELPS